MPRTHRSRTAKGLGLVGVGALALVCLGTLLGGHKGAPAPARVTVVVTATSPVYSATEEADLTPAELRHPTTATSTRPPTATVRPTDTTLPPDAVTFTVTPGPIAARGANLRAGPGTGYPIVGGLRAGQPLEIMARNRAGDWLQLASGAWVFSQLVRDAPDVPVAAVIPTLQPPTRFPTIVPVRATEVPVVVPPPPARVCCKICTTGKACGDSCIARSKTCHKGVGCACDG